MSFQESVQASFESKVLMYQGNLDRSNFLSPDDFQLLNSFTQITIIGNLTGVFNEIPLAVSRLIVTGNIIDSFNQSQLVVNYLTINGSLTNSFNQSLFQGKEFLLTGNSTASLSGNSFQMTQINIKTNGEITSSIFQSTSVNLSGTLRLVSVSFKAKDVILNLVKSSGIKLHVESDRFSAFGSGSIGYSSVNCSQVSVQGQFTDLFNNSYLHSDNFQVRNTGSFGYQSQLDGGRFIIDTSGSSLIQAQISVVELNLRTGSDGLTSSVFSGETLIVTANGSVLPATIKVTRMEIEASPMLNRCSVMCQTALLTGTDLLHDTVYIGSSLTISGICLWGQRSSIEVQTVVRSGEDQPECLYLSIFQAETFTHRETFRPGSSYLSIQRFQVGGYIPQGAVTLADVDILDLRFPSRDIVPVDGIRTNNILYLFWSLVSGRPKIIKGDPSSWATFKASKYDQTPFRAILRAAFPSSTRSSGRFYSAIVQALDGNARLVFNDPIQQDDFIASYPFIQRKINTLQSLVITGPTIGFGFLTCLKINRVALLGSSNQLFFLGQSKVENLILNGSVNIQQAQLKGSSIQIDAPFTIQGSLVNVSTASILGSSLSIDTCLWQGDLQSKSDRLNGIDRSIFFGSASFDSSGSGFTYCYIEGSKFRGDISGQEFNFQGTTIKSPNITVRVDNGLDIMFISGSTVNISGTSICNSSAILTDKLTLVTGSGSGIDSYIRATQAKITANGNYYLSHFQIKQAQTVLRSPLFLTFCSWWGETHEIIGNGQCLACNIDGSQWKSYTGFTFNQSIIHLKQLEIRQPILLSSLCWIGTINSQSLITINQNNKFWSLRTIFLYDSQSLYRVKRSQVDNRQTIGSSYWIVDK